MTKNFYIRWIKPLLSITYTIAMLELIPIQRLFVENDLFSQDPALVEILKMTVDYYKTIGYEAPWIGYFARLDHEWVGSAGIKGKPVQGKIEIAYGVFDPFQKQGIGTQICKALVDIAQNHDPSVLITARTLTDNLASHRILEKNQFQLQGTIMDPDDGEVWEWLYVGNL